MNTMQIRQLGNNPEYNHGGDLRKHRRTFIAQLKNVPDGAKFRHCREDLYAEKTCDAYQTVFRGDFNKTAIFSLNDLVEVIA